MESTSQDPSLNPEDAIESLDADDTGSLDVIDASSLSLEAKTDEGRENKGMLEEAVVNHVLCTPTQPIDADHSFSGVSFTIEAKSGFAKYRIRSISVQGNLGNVSVYASESKQKLEHAQEPHIDQYLQLANATFEPSFEEQVVIKIPGGAIVEAGCNRSFYVHCDWPDDQGLIYQSYRKPVICNDSHLRLLPGFGHTSNVPFSLMDGYHGHGWWVPERGYTGTIEYDEVYTIWNPENHKEFPSTFQEAVLTLLLCNAYGKKAPVTKLPTDCLHHIISYMHPLWFEQKETIPEFGKAEMVRNFRPRLSRWMHWFNPANDVDSDYDDEVTVDDEIEFEE